MLYLDLAALAHRHGDSWSSMAEVEATTPDDHDPERRLLAGERVYRCEGCDVEIMIGPRSEEIDQR